MKRFKHILQRIGSYRFKQAEEGAVLVEFALVFPLMLLFFAITIESAHTFWNYQVAISGVRDASRYLGRVVPVNICNPMGSLSGYDAVVMEIVSKNMDLNPAFPTTVTVDGISLTLSCENGPFRVNPAPIATIQAQLTIQYPMGYIFSLFGNGLTSVQTVVEDQSRIIGQ
ncbi:MAG: TadE/TadG family type IV pilus assembly protein [Paracoccaceae bacterium]